MTSTLPTNKTTTTFINGLKGGDADAWQRFKSNYRPVIRRVCRDLAPADIESVLQLTEEKVRRHVAKFERLEAGSFRNYVRKTAYSQLCTVLKKRSREGQCPLEEAFNLTYRRCEIKAAAQIVRRDRRFKDAAWRMFHLRFEQTLTPVEIAKEMNKSIDSVYKSIRRIVEAIDKELETGGANE